MSGVRKSVAASPVAVRFGNGQMPTEPLRSDDAGTPLQPSHSRHHQQEEQLVSIDRRNRGVDDNNDDDNNSAKSSNSSNTAGGA